MNIFESIAAVQADVDFIGKDKQVQSGGNYKYRGVDQVLNTLHPLFTKHKVFAVPEVLEILERELRETSKGSKMLYQILKIKYTFYAEDGTSVSAIVVGEAMDSGDKVSNKCMSVAYKYACFQILSIPTEETTPDPDDNAESFAQKSTPNPDDRKPVLSLRDLKDLGVEDTEGMARWLEEQLGKAFEDFDESDREWVVALVKRQQEKRKAREREIAEAENIPPPLDDNE